MDGVGYRGGNSICGDWPQAKPCCTIKSAIYLRETHCILLAAAVLILHGSNKRCLAGGWQAIGHVHHLFCHHWLGRDGITVVFRFSMVGFSIGGTSTDWLFSVTRNVLPVDGLLGWRGDDCSGYLREEQVVRDE